MALGRFNVIIGANASGKSNFTQIFNFLKDITSYGLDNAIALQGGLEYLRNFNIGSRENLLFEITFKASAALLARFSIRSRMRYKLRITKAIYRFEIKLGKYSGFKIIDDIWLLNVDAYARDSTQSPEKFFSGEVTMRNKQGKLVINTKFPQDIKITKENITPPIFSRTIKSKSLLIENYFIMSYVLDMGEFFDEIEVYDFDPKLAKRAIPIKGIAKLKNDGSNLAIALKSVIENQESKRKFSNLITDLLPFVDSIDTEKFVDRSILFMLKERYFKHQSLPSTLISDGTVNITALILALYFQSNQLTVIEEPERNIHPSLMSQVVEMMKEASCKSQVIVTTHNPEMIRYAKIENVLTVKRDEKGYSEIIRPGDQEDVKNFLENDMDVKELYVQNLLGD